MPFRFSASRNGPFGLCQAEPFGNSFADSVSFRFPSWQSLDGRPVTPANSAPGHATPPPRLPQLKKLNGDRPLESLSPLTLRHVSRATPVEFALATLVTPSLSRGRP